MPVFQGLCFFPGVQHVVSATYTLSHGITPGVCTIECAPQFGFVGAGGLLEFQFGPVIIQFANCKVDTFSFRFTQQGRIWALQVLDRRWKWAFGEAWGLFNKRLPDESVDPVTAATPQQLAAYLLDQMGETGYDVTQLPNDTQPEVEWEAANPAQELASLCERLGCRIVLTLGGFVVLARTGVGGTLDTTADVLQNSLTIDPPERPDALRVVCGKTRYEAVLVLDAVGLDVNGDVKPIDDLSYKPAGGWATTTPPFFSQVVAGTARQLAQKTVFRWYRITDLDPADPTQFLALPDYGTLTNYQLLLPLEEGLLTTYLDERGNKKTEEAWILGIFWDGGLGYANTLKFITEDFSIGREEGIVEFSRAIFQYTAAGPVAADLLLRIAFSIRDPVSLAYLRATRTAVYPSGNWGTGARILKRDEIARTVSVTYDAAFNVVGSVTNDAVVDTQATYYLLAADLEYQTPTPQEVTYAGLKPISPDGAIQQVAWTVGPNGATTTASRNNEFSTTTPSYKERRLTEYLAGRPEVDLRRQIKETQDAVGGR